MAGSIASEGDMAVIPTSPRFRVVVRDADGTLHLDWPLGDLAAVLATPEATVWLDIDDRNGDLAGVEELFHDLFHFHPLAIEDALQETNNPKLDDWGEYLYLVFHAMDFDAESLAARNSELDVFLGRNYLVTYHGDPLPMLDSLRRLIERDGGQRLALGSDHLLYHLLDLGVDAYLPAFEHLDDAIDAVQDEVLAHPTQAVIRKIMRIKHAALKLHRALPPLREILNRLARDEYAPIDARDRVYFRDVYDHLVRLHDISETLRDLIAGALDTYLSALSNRTNEVMKALTIVTVLFLPLNFVVGFFGMNFFGDNIHLDSLGIPHAALFALICVSMLVAPWAMWTWARWRRWF